jgi:hypothetical protein
LHQGVDLIAYLWLDDLHVERRRRSGASRSDIRPPPTALADMRLEALQAGRCASVGWRQGRTPVR